MYHEEHMHRPAKTITHIQSILILWGITLFGVCVCVCVCVRESCTCAFKCACVCSESVCVWGERENINFYRWFNLGICVWHQIKNALEARHASDKAL